MRAVSLSCLCLSSNPGTEKYVQEDHGKFAVSGHSIKPEIMLNSHYNVSKKTLRSETERMLVQVSNKNTILRVAHLP